MTFGNAAEGRTRQTLWLLVGLVVAVAILLPVLAISLGWTGSGMMGVGMMGGVMLLPIVVLVLVLLVVLGAFDQTPVTSDASLEALNLRLARGDVSLEEYETLRREIRR